MIDVIDRDRTDVLGEGPFWSVRHDALFWTDIRGQMLSRWNVADGRVSAWPMPEMTGWIIEREGDCGFLVGCESAILSLTIDPFRLDVFARPPGDSHGREHRFNDACADATGTIWAGTMLTRANAPDGSLYRLGSAGDLRRAATGYTVPNGPVTSPDGRHLIVADSPLRTIFRAPIGRDGALGHRAAYIIFEESWGFPDGMTIDSEGYLWVCHYKGGRISRFDPHGRLDRSIEMPTSLITSCAFGGAALDQLFVTSASFPESADAFAGALFRLDVGVTGLEPSRYAG